MTSIPAGWEGILEPGERILWQGRPGGALSLRRESVVDAAFGLPLAVFGLFWLFQTRGAGPGLLPSVVFPAVGAAMVLAGLWQILGKFWWQAHVRRHSWYTLTDRRAFIAREILGRRDLRFWPVDEGTLLDYDGEEPGTIWFAEEWHAGFRPGRRRVGFEMLDDARAVLALMRRVQHAEGHEGTRT